MSEKPVLQTEPPETSPSRAVNHPTRRGRLLAVTMASGAIGGAALGVAFSLAYKLPLDTAIDVAAGGAVVGSILAPTLLNGG